MSAGGEHAPTVSVLVLNFNGREHLEQCLPSLRRQTYPAGRFEIVVVDNGSSDGSPDWLREQHPDVRVVGFSENRGFAAAYNAAVSTSDAEFVAFLNNDTRVEPDWLAELAGAARRHGAASVGSKMLDWSGEKVDFAGGIVSLFGHSWQRDEGRPAATRHAEDRLLFACAGSMLVGRRIFEEVGGFDPDFFAYFEDVDLGWRLSLFGYDNVLAPRAITYHRARGTSGRVALSSRLRLYERNALAMIVKNYEQATLDRVLPAAVALTAARAFRELPLNPESYAMTARPPLAVGASPRFIAHLIALEEFGRQLPSLLEKRDAIQRRRRRSDRELFALFGDPLRVHDLGDELERIAAALIEAFELESLVSNRPRRPLPARPAPPAAPLAVSVREQPSVSIVVLTALGPTHLRDCLSSLEALTYPAALREVIVVDNGSADDPEPVASEAYAGARVIRLPRNLGFAVGNNLGAIEARGDLLAFLNDDTKVHPEWLSELVATARRRQAASAGSRILDWDGARIDFVGGSVNFEAKGFQRDFGAPVAGRRDDEQPLLFACGAALLVDRRVFEDIGGWDEATFAYYEDVELGWRLRLMGHEVWLSPRSLVFHRHHGTSDRWPEPPRIRLFERNSLRMLYTHLDDGALRKVLPAAIMLAADRALLESGLGRAGPLHPGERPPGRWQAVRARVQPAVLGQTCKRALAMHGARKHFSVARNLREVGPVGLVRAALWIGRETLFDRAPDPAARRPGYFIELGPRARSFDVTDERLPPSAGARLLGLDEFLKSLPELTERRLALQARRARTDVEVLGPFSTHWLSSTPSVGQRAHDELQRILRQALRIEDVTMPIPSTAERQ
jgi:GT2 family glycosyltransferase